jgi:hypothetical protein
MNDKLGRRIFKTGAVLLMAITAVRALSLLRALGGDRKTTVRTNDQLQIQFDGHGTACRADKWVQSGVWAGSVGVWKCWTSLCGQRKIVEKWPGEFPVVGSMLMVSVVFLVPTSFLALALVVCFCVVEVAGIRDDVGNGSWRGWRRRKEKAEDGLKNGKTTGRTPGAARE